jgi:hypothetical protein
MKTAFHWGHNENLSEMLRTIRKRLKSILACIFALRKLDKGEKMASTSKIRRKKDERPRKPKKLVNVWESPFGKMLRDPDSSLESTAPGKFRLRVRVPFSVYQMIVDKFRTIPEWEIYKDSSSKRGRPHPLELKVMASLYILGRAATYISYMSEPDNNIPVEECETEGSWSTLRALLITHYKYAKLNNLIRWVTYTSPISKSVHSIRCRWSGGPTAAADTAGWRVGLLPLG